MIEIDRVDWTPGRALEDARRLGLEASERAARELLDRASARVPRATGELEASATIEVGEDEVAAGYTVAHARYVHAHPEWNFQGGRSGHWLEEAAESDAGDIEGIYADTIRSGWPG